MDKYKFKKGDKVLIERADDIQLSSWHKKGDIYEISVVTEDNFCVMTCGTGVYAHRLEKVG